MLKQSVFIGLLILLAACRADGEAETRLPQPVSAPWLTSGPNVLTTSEDQAVKFVLTAQAADLPEGTVISFTAMPGNGTLDVSSGNAPLEIVYQPGPNFVGTDTLEAVATLADGTELEPILVTIIVAAVNDAPTATADSLVVTEDTVASIEPLANDVDIDGDMLILTSVSEPAHGTARLEGATRIIYTPAANYSGTDSITYSLQDSSGETATATISITVNLVDDPAIVNDDLVSVAEDGQIDIDVLANDSDPDSTIALLSVAMPSHGTASIVDGVIRYVPDADYAGEDEFSYTATGGTAAVRVLVSAVNDAPVANDDAVNVIEDTALVIAPLANDTDIDDAILSLLDVSEPGNGSLVMVGANAIKYTPNANYSGSDSFTYTVRDAAGATDTATVAVTVAAVNDAPNAANDVALAVEDTLASINALVNDSDLESTPTISAVGVPAHGTAAINGSAIDYTPAADFSGTDTFTYTISDGDLIDSATVTVTVSAVNDAPAPVDDAPSTAEDTPIDIAVTANDVDVDDATLIVTAVSTPANGTANITAVGTVRYVPAPDFSGDDSFTYTVRDAAGATGTATVAVTVTAVDDAPLAIDDLATATEDTLVSIDVLANDSDELAPVFDAIVDAPAFGTAIYQAGSGQVEYTPTSDYAGADSFSYRINDGVGTSTATVWINVLPVNDAPAGVDDVLVTNEDTATVVNVLANDSDVDSTLFVIESVSGATNGTLEVIGIASVRYTPNLNYSGTDSFSYTVRDAEGSTATANVAVTISPVNDLPVVANDAAVTNEDTFVDVAVLDNDSDLESAANLQSVGTPANGVASIVGTQVRYTPNADFNGSDQFSYTASDGSAAATAWVTVTVNPVNDAPVTVNETGLATDSVTPIVVNVLGNDSDPEGAVLRITNIAQPVSGTVTLNVDQTLTYQPAHPAIGTVVFGYTIADDLGATASGTVTVEVSLANVVTISSFTAAQSRLAEGRSTTLQWESVFSSECSISQGVLSGGAGTGMISVAPVSTQSYALECAGPGGPARAELIVEVHPDTDHDGISDLVELTLGFNPNDADSDDDGLLDGGEDVNGNGIVDSGETDPHDPDSDGDGFCDGWRADNDGDGLSPADACMGGQMLFVDDSATGTGDGQSWVDAFTSIQSAVDAAAVGQEIWIAEGIYLPALVNSPVLTLAAGIDVYGGFVGNEHSKAQRPAPLAPTILSGDFDLTGTQRSPRVVIGASNARLDGVIIESGEADTGANTGGGLYATGAVDLAIANVTIRNNTAVLEGAGAYIDAGSVVTFDNVIFRQNMSGGQGGGLVSRGSTIRITDSTFHENSANKGGGMAAYGGFVTLTATQVTNNQANDGGGGFFNDTIPVTLVVQNSEFRNNSAGASWGGGGIATAWVASVVRISDSLFEGNSGYQGGGMWSHAAAGVTLTTVTFRNNTAIGGGGGAQVTYTPSEVILCVFEDNTTGDSGSGGGLYASSDPLLVVNSVFEGNVANGGGGLAFNSGAATIVGSRFVGNVLSGYGQGTAININNSTALVISKSEVLGHFGNSAVQVNGSDASLLDLLFVDNDGPLGLVGGVNRVIGASFINSRYMTMYIYSGAHFVTDSTFVDTSGMSWQSQIEHSGVSGSLLHVANSGFIAQRVPLIDLVNTSQGRSVFTNIHSADLLTNSNGDIAFAQNGATNRFVNATIYGNESFTGSGFLASSAGSTNILENVAISGGSAGAYVWNGGAFAASNSCSTRDLTNYGSGSAVLAGSPWAVSGASKQVFLDPVAGAACQDIGSEASANDASYGFVASGLPNWWELSTQSDGTLDVEGAGTNDVDAGRHYDPNAVRIDTFSVDAENAAWTTSNAASCRLMYSTGSTVTTVATSGAIAHEGGPGIGVYVECRGIGEPAVAGTDVP